MVMHGLLTFGKVEGYSIVYIGYLPPATVANKDVFFGIPDP